MSKSRPWTSNQPPVARPSLPTIRPLDLVAFDPGGSTGVIEIVQGVPVASYTFSYMEFIAKLAAGKWDYCKLWVIEEFKIYPWKSAELGFNEATSARLIGALTLQSLHAGGDLRIEMQWAATAKTSISDDRLKLYGWWLMLNSNHERDAARHALHYLLYGGK